MSDASRGHDRDPDPGAEGRRDTSRPVDAGTPEHPRDPEATVEYADRCGRGGHVTRVPA